jgi:DNA-binding transcriptional regulator YbjK
VPLATTSYFFASINELLEEATRTFTAARATELAVVATQIPRGASPDEIAAIFAAALLTGDRASELAQIEAYLHAARESGLREPVAEAAEGARVFVALADGFVLQHLARPRPDDEAVLRDALRAMFVAFAMTAEERAAWDRRFAQSVAAQSVTAQSVAAQSVAVPSVAVPSVAPPALQAR